VKTSKRNYRLGKRGEAAAATRRRIVESTLVLHDEQGITRTSIRDVAGRAGVAPATVLHHFPRMDDLIRACGELSDAMAPMPHEAEVLAGVGAVDRLRLLVAALFRWWEQLGPGWDHLQVDRRYLPQVDAWLRSVRERHRQLAETAIGPAGAEHVELVVAATGQGMWRSLHESGVRTDEAAARVASLLIAGLGLPEAPKLRSPSSTRKR
jgi:AcrR family transcriptional regulator